MVSFVSLTTPSSFFFLFFFSFSFSVLQSPRDESGRHLVDSDAGRAFPRQGKLGQKGHFGSLMLNTVEL